MPTRIGYHFEDGCSCARESWRIACRACRNKGALRKALLRGRKRNFYRKRRREMKRDTVLFVRVQSVNLRKMERAMKLQGYRSRSKFIDDYLKLCLTFDMSKAE